MGALAPGRRTTDRAGLDSGRKYGTLLALFATPASFSPQTAFGLEPAEAQVIGSPHIGAGTQEAKARVGEEVADKMIGFYREHF